MNLPTRGTCAHCYFKMPINIFYFQSYIEKLHTNVQDVILTQQNT